MERIERPSWCCAGIGSCSTPTWRPLYQVETKALVQAIKRNIERFPADFMFWLSEREFENFRRQVGTSSSWGGRRYPPLRLHRAGGGDALQRVA